MKTIKDIEEELKVSRRTVYRWIKSGRLKVLKVGGRLRIEEEEFQAFLDKARGGRS